MNTFESRFSNLTTIFFRIISKCIIFFWQEYSFTLNNHFLHYIFSKYNEFMRYSLYEVLIDILSSLQSLPEDAGYGGGSEHTTEIKATKFSKAKLLKVMFFVLVWIFCLWLLDRVKCYVD